MNDQNDRTAREIAHEQAYTDRLYARVDELLARLARDLDSVQHSQHASTHQNRSERDAFMALYEDRLQLLRTVSHDVVFGRLDTDAGEHHYIGRIGLFTPEREQLLVDWRAPAAAAYYQATSVERLGIRLRRHLITENRTVLSLEDDVLDQQILSSADELPRLQGEGSLLAAVRSQRTGRMGDIVATIQAEQDRIIRDPGRGVQVVQGGPGTGKTAVALHRAAYLLYTHRTRLEHTGVLILAPTAGFLRYIERVLPSLGESGVVMLASGRLFPGVDATARDRAEVAVTKGDVAMAELLARAVRDRQIIPDQDVPLSIDGTAFTLTRDEIAAARREARASHKPHNAARATFVRATMDRLVESYEAALGAGGHTVVPEDRPDLLRDLRSDPTVRRTLNLCWMPYTPESFLRILFAHPERLRAAAPRGLADTATEALARPKDAEWTLEDVPLLDEVAELLGDDESIRRAEQESDRVRRTEQVEYAREVLENVDTSGMVRAEDLADRIGGAGDRRSLSERALSDRSWAYGHVVVDEAQELSAMMWRAIMRRCPTKSMTVVGDVAQTSAAAGATSWTQTFAPYVDDRLAVEELTVNYRTPRRIMDAAQRVADAMGLPVTPVTSVREGEFDVAVHRASPEDVVAHTSARALQLRREGTGRIAVICPPTLVDDVVEQLRADARADADIGIGSTGVDRELAVMTAQDAKGLEFDGVVIAEPSALVDAIPELPGTPSHAAGHRAGDLYVAMTRPTQRLELVHSTPLPEGL